MFCHMNRWRSCELFGGLLFKQKLWNESMEKYLNRNNSKNIYQFNLEGYRFKGNDV